MASTMGLNVGNNNSSNGEGIGVGVDGGFYSPAKEKAANRSVYNYNGRCWQPFRRFRQTVCSASSVGKVKFIFSVCVVLVVLALAGRTTSLMWWSSRAMSPPAVGYTVLINTWKRESLLKRSVQHYASCRGTDAIRVVWSESSPPSESLKLYLQEIIQSKSQISHKPKFRFDLNEEDNLNNRFKPMKDLKTQAIFSVDDDVVVPCQTLDFAFTVWQSAPDTMVGFVPRMHWLDEKKGSTAYYKYGGWWSVWWMGTYSMVLSKAAFLHKKYLDMYTQNMPSSIREYVARERNCEDLAMSLLVANATGAPPIWVKGKIYEIGSFGISSLKGHSMARNRCLNEFVALYGTMPLVPTNVKAVDAQNEWLW